MTWAGRRRFLVISIIAAFAVFIIAITSIAALYKAPSCSDNIQNQGEDGIDCGGPCSYLCTLLEQDPTVRFTKALQEPDGRIDVVASVANPNASAAARDVAYKVTLYAADHTALKTVHGSVDLPPSSVIPVFIADVFNGTASGTQAFLTIDASAIHWFSSVQKPVVPLASNPTLGGTENAPRITATLTNPQATVFTNVRVVATVFDSHNNVIAASATLIPLLAGQATATATFTWPRAFSTTPARIEVVPVATLPFP